MSNRRPNAWMPIYWGDYSRDTAALNALCHGAYLMLLAHLWCTERGIPDDDVQLCRITRCDDLAEWRRVRPLVAGFFEIADGIWRHRRVERELDAARRRCESRSAIGRAGAEARWGKCADGNASTMRQHHATATCNIVDETAGDGGVSESGGNPPPRMLKAMPLVMPSASGRQCHPQPQPQIEDKNIGRAASPQRPVRAKVDLEGFDRFWSAWPNKVKKPAAQKAWLKALAAASVDVILAGVERYKRAKPDWQSWPHPATWLRNQQWNDEGLTDGAPAMTETERAALLAGRQRLEQCPICRGKGMAALRYGARHGVSAGRDVSTKCPHDASALRAFCERGGFEWPGDPASTPSKPQSARQPAMSLSIGGSAQTNGGSTTSNVADDDDWSLLEIPEFLQRNSA